MFSQNNKYKKEKPMPSDPELSHLLHQWQGLAPPSDFESGVWKRIASERCPESSFAIVYGLFFRLPGLGTVSRGIAAVTVGILLGISTVIFHSAPIDEPVLETDMTPFQSLTRAYTKMVTGGENET